MKKGEELIAKFLAESLDASEVKEFRRCLERDSALRQKLGEQASLHGQLDVLMEDEVSKQGWISECLNRCAVADQENFLSGVQRKLRLVRFKRTATIAAAAMIALALGLALWSPAPQPAAIISQIRTSEAGSSLRVGDHYNDGDTLQVGSGLVELDLPGRGRMIVEGPTELTFTNATHANLVSGRIHLRVTENGRGYRLKTPKGVIVDLGTEFGVAVNRDSGTVETHVLDGEVEALVDDRSAPIHLKKNEALLQSGSLKRRFQAEQSLFYTSLPPIHVGSVGMVHWSLEPGSDNIVNAQTQTLSEQGADLKLRGHPQLTEGPFGNALQFDGKGTYAETSYRGVKGNMPRTVAFWVNVPSDFKTSQAFAMVSWGDFKQENPGAVWQISINPVKQDGLIGRLRLGVHGGQVIGSTDLRDDQWHHVAVILYPAEQASLGQQVLLYVDGKLESLSNRVLNTIDTEVETSSHGVWLGRDVNTSKVKDGFFRGKIDEVYIFDVALSQEEIQTLMERNEPPR